jgi:putative endonuclease
MKEHEYFVYIVCSNSGTLYIGMTNSIYRRAFEHKHGEIEGFVKKYNCVRLVYYEGFDDVRKAIDREKQLKGWVRRKKKEDCFDRIEEPTLGRLSGKMGSSVGVCR